MVGAWAAGDLAGLFGQHCVRELSALVERAGDRDNLQRVPPVRRTGCGGVSWVAEQAVEDRPRRATLPHSALDLRGES